MAQTLTQIMRLLEDYGLRPKHRYGQNFLHDGNQMQRIMDAAEVGDGDVVLEVGPGTGALSVRLLDAGARLLAVEIDGDMQQILAGEFAGYGEKAELIIADVLKGKHELNPEVVEKLGEMAGDDGHFKMVANLPYNVASPLLVNLVSGIGLGGLVMDSAVVMIQREVAGRLVAGPGGKDFGPLGVMIQAMCEVQMVGVLAASCFWPAPEVESAVVLLRRRERALTDDPVGLSKFLQVIFGKRRKQLGAILGRKRAFPAGIEMNFRPEVLTVEQIIELCGWYNEG